MKKLLIVVDYQNDFVAGSLGFPKAEELEDRIYYKIKKYKENNDEIIFTFDIHEKDYLNTQEGRNLPIEHCIRGTFGAELYGKIKDIYDENNMKKFCKNTFGSLELANYLKERAYESIEFVGLVSNICVISNVVLVKAALPEVPIILDSQCTAGNDKNMNEKALDVMRGLQIKII